MKTCINCGITEAEAARMYDRPDGKSMCDNCCMADVYAEHCEDCGAAMRFIGNVTSAEGVDLALYSCDFCDVNREEEIIEEPYYPPRDI